MVDIFAATGLNVLLRFPVSLVLLNSDIDTYSSRRGRGIDFESAEHGVVEVASVLGTSTSPDGCGGVVPALLILLSVTAEETSNGRDNDGKVAHGQGDIGLEGTTNSLPSTGNTKD